MASQPDPPKLDTTHDAETIALLGAIREAKIGDVSARVDALEAHLAERINGDLRPRILAFEKELGPVREELRKELDGLKGEVQTLKGKVK